MATIVGIETEEGAVLAGDRLLVEDGTVKSDSKRHVFDFDGVGAAAVGDSNGIDEFRRELESEVQSYETEESEPMRIGRLATVASNLSVEGVEAIVVGRDDDATAHVRGIDADGGIITDETLVFGSGAQMALGILEGRDEGLGLDDAEELARDAVETAMERDTETGGEVDTYRLASE
jgi:proteasome beta subunit